MDVKPSYTDRILLG